MLKIQDAVNCVLNAMKLRGCTESTLEHNKWSIYNPIINFHTKNGTDNCSNKLLKKMCQQQEARFIDGKIGRKYYSEFVTAVFRIQSYAKTGEVDFSVVKDTKQYKPQKKYQDIIDAVLVASGLSPSHQCKLGVTMRHFFCFYEKRHSSISEITDRDFIDFIPIVAKNNPNNMNASMRALRYIIEYLNAHHLADIKIDIGVFNPKAPPHRLIAPFTQSDINAMLSAIKNNSKTPKRDTAIILLAFNSGLRCVDIRNLCLHNIDWQKQEVQIVQRKTGVSISSPLSGKTLNAIAEYILEERPKSDDTHIFLRAVPPYTALKSTSPLDYMIDKYCRISSIDKIEGRSFHSLRRALGTELAIAETPITSISQMLGHRNMSSDKAYISFNNTQTTLCASGFSEVPITKGVYAAHRLNNLTKIEKGGEPA